MKAPTKHGNKAVLFQSNKFGLDGMNFLRHRQIYYIFGPFLCECTLYII